MSRLLDETKQLIKTHRLKPAHVSGQNFLICEDVLDRIVSGPDIAKEDYILEIGPGLGVLTNHLITKAKKVVVVEYDRNVIPILETIKLSHNNLEIINGDILGIKNEDLVKHLGSDDYRVVANIPYHITSRIIRKFLSYQPKPRDLWLLVQKEVAERITAVPGRLSMLAISVQFYAQPEIIDIVSRECFYPVPKVDSAMISIKLHNKYLNLSDKYKISEKQFWSIVHSGFSNKRKTLVNNLSNSLHQDKQLMEDRLLQLKLDKNVRAQELTIEQWIKLTSSLSE